MIGTRNKLLIVVFILAALLLASNSIFAEELSFGSAVELGLENNLELAKLESDIEQLQLELKKIKAESDWQVDISTESQVNNFTDQVLNVNDETVNTKEIDLSLAAVKNYWSGLTFKPEIYFSDQDLEDGQGNDPQFKLSITQDIYPKIAIPAEQNYIQQQLEVEIAKEELAEQINIQMINCVEQYLELLRLKEKYNLAQQNYHLAQDKLAETLAQKKIGETGELELLQKKVSLKQADYQLENSKNSYQQTKKNLANDLGLNSSQELKLADNSEYLAEIREISELVAAKLNNQDELLRLAKENNQQLLSVKLNRQSMEYNLEWKKLADKADVKLLGSYDSADQKWQAGVSVSYNVFDSGKQNYEEENLQQKIDILQQEKLDLLRDIELRVAELVKEIKTQKINLEAEELSLEEAKLAREIAKKQLEKGLITQIEFDRKELDLKESKINGKEAEDKLLISRLELINYLGGKLE